MKFHAIVLETGITMNHCPNIMKVMLGNGREVFIHAAIRDKDKPIKAQDFVEIQSGEHGCQMHSLMTLQIPGTYFILNGGSSKVIHNDLYLNMFIVQAKTAKPGVEVTMQIQEFWRNMATRTQP